MRLRIFQSGKGDCMLITSLDNKNILVDGGVSAAFTKHVSPELSKLHAAGKKIDLVCVSHIDDDHIGGILKMVEDLVDWKVNDFHTKNRARVTKPKSFRPPEMNEMWHNAFHTSINKNTGQIEKMLAASATILGASENSFDEKISELAYSTKQAIQLSRRLKANQLNIPLNSKFGGKLIMARANQKPIKIGQHLKITLIAPFPEDLKKLRDDWNKWLSDNHAAIKSIEDKVKKDANLLTTAYESDLSYLLELASLLGDRKKVTPPNLASIMFLVEENNNTLLMTGDGHWQDILNGLEKIKRLDKTKGLHLNVLKVQHHGSEHNIHENFCQLVSADNYVFCGNGAHTNPEIEVIKLIVESRIRNGVKKCITPQAGKSFTLWFNSNSKATDSSNKKQMKAVEKLVNDYASSNSKVKVKFIPDNKSFIDMNI